MRRTIGFLFAALLAGCANTTNNSTANTQPANVPDAGKAANTSKVSGQCHCGLVKYESQGPVIRSSYCDCPGCQKASGAMKAPYVTVPSVGFKVIAGEPSKFRAACGVKCDTYGVWHFCPTCGGPVFWRSDNGKEVDIFAGTLDDTSIFQPKE